MKTDLVFIYDKGTEVFGGLSKFTKWLGQENAALENKIPLDLIKTEEGFKLVLLELSKIEKEE